MYICVSKIFSSTTFIQALCRYSKILVYTCVSTILALEFLFQALRQYSNILAYTCVSTIFSSRTVILRSMSIYQNFSVYMCYYDF